MSRSWSLKKDIKADPEGTELHTRLVEIAKSYGGYIGVRNNDMWVAMFEKIEEYALQWHTTIVEQAVLEARLDEVRIGSDMHQLMRRTDRIAWSNSRYQELESQQARKEADEQ